MPDEEALREIAKALDILASVERERTKAWAFAALLDGPAGREARMEAERGVEEAREALRRARARVILAPGEKAWSGH